ncbi:hypothetical protein ACFPVX_20610 [Cohnella faecalis]|uniref:DUF3679 domain-containing protein n=1 Tax=Cohnella faecalis TaxID=2315694 RepID=A0A398CZ17_9BACL|nr:hypothetical protein [Cohnella faecalis]RIE04174.1 hypothetical protein D3H35_05995 [Cohnella faecalis]
MRRDTFKLLLMAAIVAFAIMYGMELASSGISSVNGPWSSDGKAGAQTKGSVIHSEEEWELPSPTPQDGATAEGKTRRQSSGENDDTIRQPDEVFIPRNDREPIVDRVSAKTATVLHDVSHSGIRIVVSLFEKITGS